MKLRLNRSAVRLLLIILIAAAVLFVVFHFLLIWDRGRYQIEPSENSELYGNNEKAVTYYNGQGYVKRESIETVLLIGLDKFEAAVPAEGSYKNNQQSDFLLLLILDHENRSYTALHINRDSMAEIPTLGVGGVDTGTVTGQLALAHTYGDGKILSCRNTVSAVSGFLYGAEIDHYVSLTMDAVAFVNDLVGGVTVTVMDDFSGVDPTLVKDTDVTLTGEQALTYVRARGSLEDSTNVHRMERQRQYLHALHQKAKELEAVDESFLIDALFDVSVYLVSDCTVNQLSDLGNDLLEYSGGDIRTIEGEAVKGEEFMEFYADEDALRELMLELLYTEA